MPAERTAIPSTLCPTTVSEGLVIALKNQIPPVVSANRSSGCSLERDVPLVWVAGGAIFALERQVL